jgi:hypothetical protein
MDFPFPGFRLMTHTTNLGASTPPQDRGKSLRIPIERTASSRLRRLEAGPLMSNVDMA